MPVPCEGSAQVEFERENWPAARDWINQALQLDRGAVEAAPDNGEFAASLRSDRYWEASISIADGDLAAATGASPMNWSRPARKTKTPITKPPASTCAA